MGRVKRIWYLSPMRAAKVQASLRIRAVWPEHPLLAHTSSESRGNFRQKARSLAPLTECSKTQIHLMGLNWCAQGDIDRCKAEASITFCTPINLDIGLFKHQ